MQPWQERVVVAYLDEPPFCEPPKAVGRPSGCDMDLAHQVLTGAGVGIVQYTLTTFAELIPGLLDGRWQITTPIFVTDERAKVVLFSRPVWVVGDGFIVRWPDVGRYTSYEAIAASSTAVLAVVEGQVQRETALRAGVPHERIVEFSDQDAAVAAVRAGRADASASTATGNRAYLERAGMPDLAAVPDQGVARRARVPLGAFAFGPTQRDLREAVEVALDAHLGTPEHLSVMAGYGFSPDDLRDVLNP